VLQANANEKKARLAIRNEASFLAASAFGLETKENRQVNRSTGHGERTTRRNGKRIGACAGVEARIRETSPPTTLVAVIP
jgi:hypothetical protein